MEEFVDMFVPLSDFKGRSGSRMHEKMPMFNVKLLVDGNKLKFEPSLNEVQSTVELLFDQLLLAANHIPKLDVYLFSAQPSENIMEVSSNTPPEQCIKVAFEDTYPDMVNNERNRLKKYLYRLAQEPNSYLVEFQRHSDLINLTAEEAVNNFLEGDQSAAKEIEVKIVSKFGCTDRLSTCKCTRKSKNIVNLQQPFLVPTHILMDLPLLHYYARSLFRIYLTEQWHYLIRFWEK
jgi:hypothetical protein